MGKLPRGQLATKAQNSSFVNTFQFNPLALRPGPCGLCGKRITSGEVCWLAVFLSIDPVTKEAKFKTALSHSECAAKSEYSPLVPDQPTWVSKATRDAISRAQNTE